MASVKDIRSACDEVKEHLLLNNYKDAMMLMAQITIEVIEHLIDENLIVSKGYEEDLKTLLTNNIINQNTEHNFETLIISGVQAHNGVEIPREHAEMALEVLESEMNVLFKNDKLPSDAENNVEKAKLHTENENGSSPKVFEYNEDDDNGVISGSFEDVGTDDKPAFFSKNENEVDFRQKERIRQTLINQENKNIKKINIKAVLLLLAPIVVIILVIIGIRGCISNMGNREAQNNTPTFEEGPGYDNNLIEPVETTTEIETTTEAGYYIVTGEAINIRTQANTNSSILARVTTGDRVQVISFYDNDWAIIRYNGRDAFISRQYIEKDSSQAAPAAQYTEE